MKNNIKSISFLYKGERVILESRLGGTFRVPHPSTGRGNRKEYKNLTAKEVVKHHIIKECDPVLTLSTGEKLRVYQGGDSSYLPAMIEGILDKHDTRENKYRLNRNKGLYASSSELLYGDQYEFPWEDLCDD